MRPALLFFVLTTGSCAGLWIAACGETDTSSVTLVEPDAADAALAPNTWGNTACATCAFTACSAERATCLADPLCARNLDCLEACDVDSNQEPTAACAAACPATSGSTESEAARSSLEICRTRGAGALCDSCYSGNGNHYAPTLTNVCNNPQWDAGADASPTDELLSKCQGEHCCALRDACKNDPQCSALIDCIVATNGDTTMQPACWAQYDSAIELYGERYGCLYAFCAPLATTLDECNRCQNEYCSDTLAICLSDHDCFLLFQCATDCPKGDTQCTTKCLAQYPAAADGFYSYIQCASTECPTCNRGGM